MLRLFVVFFFLCDHTWKLELSSGILCQVVVVFIRSGHWHNHQPLPTCRRQLVVSLLCRFLFFVITPGNPSLAEGFYTRLWITSSFLQPSSLSSSCFLLCNHTRKPELSSGILYQVVIHFSVLVAFILCCLLVFFFVITPGNPSLAQGFYTRLWSSSFCPLSGDL